MMIKYRYLRFLAATGWGCVAMIFTMSALWIFTEIEIQNVLFWMIFAYMVVMGLILWFTEQPSKKVKSHRQQETRRQQPRAKTTLQYRTTVKPRKASTTRYKASKKITPIYTWNEGTGKWMTN